MMNKRNFYSAWRNYFGKLNRDQVNGIETLLDLMQKKPFSHPCFVSHVFAEIRHECANTWEPIKEYGSKEYLSYLYDKENVRKALGNDKVSRDKAIELCGHGYIMITGYNNFKWASELVGIDLIEEPEKALIPEISYEIMHYGLMNGKFTGKKLTDFWIDEKRELFDHYDARKCVNGIVPRVANQIREDARKYERILDSSGWY